jgi:hypothetical protein
MKKFLFISLALVLTLMPYSLDARKHKYPNGDVYDGEWKNKAPNGMGIMMYVSGEIYSGAWVNGLREGSGAMSFQNGDQYSGDWKNDVFCGEGKMTYANKDVYEGSWDAGKQHGKGKMTYADGSSYEGAWEAGAFQGVGTRIYANGDVYEGSWIAGVQSGSGNMKYASGASYTGNWENGTPSGHGDMLYAGGNTYSGQWKQGQPSGPGELYDKEHDRYLTGNWDGEAVGGAGSVRFGGDVATALIIQGEWLSADKFQTSYSLQDKTFSGTVNPLTGDGVKGPFLESGKVEWPDDMVADGKWMPDVNLVDCNCSDLVDGRARYKMNGKAFDGEIKDGKECNGTLTISIQGKFNFSGEVKDGQYYGIYVGDFKGAPLPGFDVSAWDEVQGADIGRVEGEGALSGVYKKGVFSFRGLLKNGLPDGDSYMEFARPDSLSLNGTWKEGRLVEGKGIMNASVFTLKGAEEGNSVQADFENGDRCNFLYTDYQSILSEMMTKVQEQRAIREKLAAEMAASQEPVEPVATE